MRNGSRALRALKRGALLLPVALLGAGNAPADSSRSVDVTITGLRNSKGFVRACITASPRSFPDCTKDANARTISVAATNGTVLTFRNLPAGRYAISVLHDENADGRMNKTLMLPREGFGFSRNARVRFGPPSFESAAFDLGERAMHTAITVRYL